MKPFTIPSFPELSPSFPSLFCHSEKATADEESPYSALARSEKTIPYPIATRY